MQGVLCVSKTISVLFSSVHCLGDKFRCLWHIQYEGGEEESDLCFGSPCRSITCQKKGEDEQLPKSLIQPLVSSRALLHLRVGKKALSGAGPPSPCPPDLRPRRGAQQPADPRDKVFVRYSCQFRSGLDKIYFFTFISFLLSHALCQKKKILLPPMTKMLNDDYNWLIIRSFSIQGCVQNWNWYEKFICNHLWYCTTNTDTYRFCFHFRVIFIYDNDLCRLVISVLCLSVINFVDPVKCYFA